MNSKSLLANVTLLFFILLTFDQAPHGWQSITLTHHAFEEIRTVEERDNYLREQQLPIMRKNFNAYY